MSPRWIKIVGRRSWKPLHEEGSHSSQAAYRWLLNRPPGEKLEQALFSKLVFPYVVISSHGATYASLGNAAWAVLVWRLKTVTGGFMFEPNAGVTWLHVLNPSEWHVTEIRGVFNASVGVVMQPVGEAMPLIRYVAAHHPHSNQINFQDVCRIAAHLNIYDAAIAAHKSRDELMQRICEHFGDVFEPKAQITEEVGVSVSALDEAVFEEFDKAEQLEFPDFCKRIQQKQARRVAADFRVQTVKVKAKAKAKAKGKRRAQKTAAATAKRRRVMAEEEGPGEEAAEAGLQPGAAEPPAVAAPDLAPPPAAEGGEQVVARVNVRHAEGLIGWLDLKCDVCSQVVGQYKLEPYPGGRDNAATWHMRVRDPDNSGEWASRYPHHRSRRTSVVGESDQFCRDWISELRSGCRCNVAA